MNAAKDTAKRSEPSEVELLLPWYAAGTLDAQEAQQVEAALAADPELARRYEWVRAEFAEETSINEAVAEPSAEDVKMLFNKIDALPKPRPAASFDLGGRVGQFLASLSPRTLAWSATGAALAIVLQAGVLAGFVVKEKIAGGYETSSAPASAQSDGAFVLIQFDPQATAAAIATFLDANKLSIVGGPQPGQLYRVRVAPNKLPREDLMRVVTTLQSDKVVGFIAMTE
jgi:anti-sigma factor RsiW